MKILRESLIEGYGAGFSFTGGTIKGMSGGTRGGFGGANNFGGPNMMYTYEIKPLNHTLEQKPTVDTMDQVETIQIGSRISGYPVRSNATPDIQKKITGLVHKIAKSPDGSIKYYIIFDEANQTQAKVDVLSASLIIHDPIEYYQDQIYATRSRRMEKMKRTRIVRELIN